MRRAAYCFERQSQLPTFLSRLSQALVGAVEEVRPRVAVFRVPFSRGLGSDELLERRAVRDQGGDAGADGIEHLDVGHEVVVARDAAMTRDDDRSEEHTSELQSPC